ncbi:MAG: DUF4145 domain-containing protein [Bifidobacterium sp.]
MTRKTEAFPVKGTTPTKTSTTWFALFSCDACGYGVLGKISFNAAAKKTEWGTRRYFSDPVSSIYITLATEEFDSEGGDIEWLPETILGKEYNDVDNDTIKDSASEAHSCYSIRAYRAAILMARSVVEAIAKDKGITDGNLKKKIAALEEQKLVSPLVREQADEIRYFGNDMAHGDFALPVSAEDAHEVLDFLDVLIDAVYQQPAKLLAMQQMRKERTQKTQDA